MGRSSLQYGTTYVKVDMFLICHVTSHDHMLKGYLRYKTITFHKKTFRKKIMFRSQNIEVFVFLTIP